VTYAWCRILLFGNEIKKFNQGRPTISKGRGTKSGDLHRKQTSTPPGGELSSTYTISSSNGGKSTRRAASLRVRRKLLNSSHTADRIVWHRGKLTFVKNTRDGAILQVAGHQVHSLTRQTRKSTSANYNLRGRAEFPTGPINRTYLRNEKSRHFRSYYLPSLAVREWLTSSNIK
jgi:hypothetical protein